MQSFVMFGAATDNQEENMGKMYSFSDGRYGVVDDGGFGEIMIDEHGDAIGEIIDTFMGREAFSLGGKFLGFVEEDAFGGYMIFNDLD